MTPPRLVASNQPSLPQGTTEELEPTGVQTLHYVVTATTHREGALA